jgi:acylphosphatase
MIRCHVKVFGRVQGVAFRWHTSRQAVELGVTGWVRNLSDGSVEGVFEGEESAVNALAEWCRKGPPAAKVERCEARQGLFSNEFDSFEIAR